LAPAALVGLAGLARFLGWLAMGRSETPLRTAALGGALLVAGILSADLPLYREAMQPTPGDAAGRVAPPVLAARL
jgi:hypothetical protein